MGGGTEGREGSLQRDAALGGSKWTALPHDWLIIVLK